MTHISTTATLVSKMKAEAKTLVTFRRKTPERH